MKHPYAISVIRTKIASYVNILLEDAYLLIHI